MITIFNILEQWKRYIPCSLDSSKIQVTTVKERTQLGLQGKFQNSQGSTVKPCLEKKYKLRKEKEGRERKGEEGRKREREKKETERQRDRNQNHVLK